MTQHHMKLATEPYNKLLSGEKLIESRLFDDKRQQITIGDQIIFSENDNPNNVFITVVTGLLRYQTFEELFADHDPSLFGASNQEFLLKQIKQFYSDEDENRWGVIGLRIRVLD